MRAYGHVKRIDVHQPFIDVVPEQQVLKRGLRVQLDACLAWHARALPIPPIAAWIQAHTYTQCDRQQGPLPLCECVHAICACASRTNLSQQVKSRQAC